MVRDTPAKLCISATRACVRSSSARRPARMTRAAAAIAESGGGGCGEGASGVERCSWSSAPISGSEQVAERPLNPEAKAPPGEREGVIPTAAKLSSSRETEAAAACTPRAIADAASCPAHRSGWAETELDAGAETRTPPHRY
eukprot:scaffold23780_cov67-Isochrysis_galbana.AAC.1